MLRICCLILVPMIFLSTVLSQNKNSSRESRKVEEFAELRKKANIIQASIESSDLDAVRRASSERLNLIKELERWAKRYKVEIMDTVEQRRDEVRGVFIKPDFCNKTLDTSGMICFVHYDFFDHSAWQCAYKCVPKNETIQRDKN